MTTKEKVVGLAETGESTVKGAGAGAGAAQETWSFGLKGETVITIVTVVNPSEDPVLKWLGIENDWQKLKERGFSSFEEENTLANQVFCNGFTRYDWEPLREDRVVGASIYISENSVECFKSYMEEDEKTLREESKTWRPPPPSWKIAVARDTEFYVGC